MIRHVCIADVYFSWLPALSGTGFAMLLLACALVWVALRLAWGPSRVHGRIGLWILRGGALAILLIILLGPTIVDQQNGAVKRSQMIYLVDGSQSMKLGKDASRWQSGLGFVSAARRTAGEEYAGDYQSFRFGHRLEPLGQPVASQAPDGPAVSVTSAAGGIADGQAIAPPEATDSRLADALRQLLPLVNGNTTAGIVLLSDGRVRASESVEQLAEFFGDAGVPLHVVPLGETSGIGDIAVVSLVVPSRVRKYTEDEVQVFLRSYGFAGQRTTVRLMRRREIADDDAAVLASVPITLTGGAQSVSLTFRVDERPEDLVVVIDPIDGELTERNNRVETRVEIDRTKVRVLHVEDGSNAANQRSALQRLFSFGADASAPGAPSGVLTVRDALQADEDIECTVLATFGGAPPREMNPQNAIALGFPKTRAELFAYDCVIFSNVGPDVLEEEHREWLAQWIEGRGGGLVVTGSEALTPAAWEGSPLLPLLPLHIQESSMTTAFPVDVDVVSPKHSVWQLRLEHRPNDRLLGQVPPLQVGAGIFLPKSTAEVLAAKRSDGAAVMMAHRAGRGRVLVSTAALSGRALASLADAWGPQPERVAAKFWRNIVYWATEGSSTGRRRLVAESDKQFYRPGEPLNVFATAYDEAAARTQKYRLWAMFEPNSLDDMTLYSPILWPDNVVRESGEVSPRIAWGEELPLMPSPDGDGYMLNLMLSLAGDAGDSGLRIEMTAYEGDESAAAFGHGTQVDSTSLAVQILSDPFEQQNPLPNHELLERLAVVSGGQVLREPDELAEILKQRPQTYGPPKRETAPAWSRWGLWISLLGLLSVEWIWRRVTGLA